MIVHIRMPCEYTSESSFRSVVNQERLSRSIKQLTGVYVTKTLVRDHWVHPGVLYDVSRRAGEIANLQDPAWLPLQQDAVIGLLWPTQPSWLTRKYVGRVSPTKYGTRHRDVISQGACAMESFDWKSLIFVGSTGKATSLGYGSRTVWNPAVQNC